MGWQVLPPTTQVALLQSLTVPTRVVQAATPVTGASPVTASFAKPVTAHNSVVVSLLSSSATTVTVTPASGPDTYTSDFTSNLAGVGQNGQWSHVSNSAGSYSSVTATLAAATLEVYAYEILGTVTFDSGVAAPSGTATFSVPFTPAASAEFLAALGSTINNPATLTTPPAAPWVNEAVLASEVVGSYQFVSSVSTVTYSGTWSIAGAVGAGVAGYKLTNPGLSTPVGQCILYYYGGSLYALGTSGVPVLLATT